MTQRYARGCRTLLLLPLLSGGLASQAATTLPDVSVTISGTIMASASCQINGGNDLSVNFGEVINTQIDGVNYNKTFDLKLDCRGGSSNAVRLKFGGTSHPKIPNALFINGNDDMGIQMKMAGVAFAPNTWLQFNHSNMPVFSAVPVKVPGGHVLGGYPGAAVVIEIDYQ